MTREEYVDRIAAVLVAHDCAEYASFCMCGKRLYAVDGLNGEGAMSMRRHRAEAIVDALGLDLEVIV